MSLNEFKSKGTPEGWIYLGDDYEYRYILGEPKEENILVFGVNPSTAKPESLDNTLKIVKKSIELIGKDDGVDYGWIMMNLCPIRKTDSKELPVQTTDINDWDEKSNCNTKCVRQVVEHFSISKVWAAWGNLIESRGYIVDEFFKISDVFLNTSDFRSIPWFHLSSLTKKKNPHHPTRLSLNLKPNKFKIDYYSWILRQTYNIDNEK